MGSIVTPVEAFRLMQESEKHGGHPCTKHIGLSNEQLMRRLAAGEGAMNNGIQYISTFTNVSDAGRAAQQTLKNIPGGIYDALDTGGNKAGFTDIKTDKIFQGLRPA
jgi:Bacterial CdiA-CT RNAse A domain